MYNVVDLILLLIITIFIGFLVACWYLELVSALLKIADCLTEKFYKIVNTSVHILPDELLFSTLLSL